MTFDIKQIEKEVNYIFSSYPSHDMISMSKAQTYWLIERVKELEEDNENYKKACKSWETINKYDRKQNKRYREAIEFGIKYLKNSDIRQVQLVVTALKIALEGENE